MNPRDYLNHESAPIRKAAARAQLACSRLDDLVEAYSGKAQARARVKALEAELAAAKAALRNGVHVPVEDLDDLPEPRAVRAWAKLNGIQVPERGRVPEDVLRAYLAAS